MKRLAGWLKTKRLLVLCGVLVLGAGIGLWQLKSGAAGGGVEVYVSAVRQQELARMLEMPGTVRLEGVEHLTARIAAPVKQVHVQVGQQVQAGQLLAELDVSDYQLDVQRFKAQVEQARWQLELAQAGARKEEIAMLEASRRQVQAAWEKARTDQQRWEMLYREGAIALQQLEAARLETVRLREELTRVEQQLAQARQGARTQEVGALKARLDEVRAGLERAQQQVAYGRVSSPISGQVLNRDVEVGQMLSVGMPMFTIGDRANLVVEGEAPEESLWALQVGREVEITGSVLRGKQCRGKIIRIAPVPQENLLKNEQSRYIFTIALSPAPADLYAGMNVQVRFELKVPGALVIPADALLEKENQADQDTVWVLEQGRARLRPVTVGVRVGRQVEILAGLKAGEKVILSPPADLNERVQVRVRGQQQS
ncbi:MAG: efflux RND transporter periplasmic adaptor subunit [Desulfurispora sp.]|uniref:efflux RND transporter periplasmic adaptor subunit n=1 Tax=Desulfurispora sp. TaxID=3014275 RepID=UPI004048F7B9